MTQRKALKLKSETLPLNFHYNGEMCNYIKEFEPVLYDISLFPFCQKNRNNFKSRSLSINFRAGIYSSILRLFSQTVKVVREPAVVLKMYYLLGQYSKPLFCSHAGEG